MTDLSTVTSNNMIQELKRRYDALIVMYLRHDTDKADALFIDWCGGVVPCVGLVEYARKKMMDRLDGPEITDVDEEDSTQ